MILSKRYLVFLMVIVLSVMIGCSTNPKSVEVTSLLELKRNSGALLEGVSFTASSFEKFLFRYEDDDPEGGKYRLYCLLDYKLHEYEIDGVKTKIFEDERKGESKKEHLFSFGELDGQAHSGLFISLARPENQTEDKVGMFDAGLVSRFNIQGTNGVAHANERIFEHLEKNPYIKGMEVFISEIPVDKGDIQPVTSITLDDAIKPVRLFMHFENDGPPIEYAVIALQGDSQVKMNGQPTVYIRCSSVSSDLEIQIEKTDLRKGKELIFVAIPSPWESMERENVKVLDSQGIRTEPTLLPRIMIQ